MSDSLVRKSPRDDEKKRSRRDAGEVNWSEKVQDHHATRMKARGHKGLSCERKGVRRYGAL